MRTDVRTLALSHRIEQIEAEAWVVLEMHFLSRPHLLDEARRTLEGCLSQMRADGVADPRALKDQACRRVQMHFGPAPALDDDLIATHRHFAQGAGRSN